MKVILLQDVKTLGKKGEIVDINDGYARNFVLPKKLGLEANGKNLNDLKLQKANDEKEAQKILEEAQAQGKKIEAARVIVKMKGGESDRVFGSISSKEIAQEAKKQFDLEIDKKKIVMPDTPIKSFGVYTLNVKLHPKVTAKLTVDVQKEN
ncbi:MAG: 50S ribosomal protein L9 [Lachnospiraceae bacterium]|nr:50S ribosomal protein L9 [Lachnospiraceae bacterium]